MKQQIFCGFDPNDPRPISIRGLSPTDIFKLTEEEAWQLSKAIQAALHGLNKKPHKP